MTADAECLSDDEVADFVDSRLGDRQRAAAERHLQGCARCTALVAHLMRSGSTAGERTSGEASRSPAANDEDADEDADAAPAFDPLPEGTTVSRYVVGKVLGVGGGGVVHEAYDPQLRRKIALKLVRAWPGVSWEAAQERLLREAHTMAALAHPNVVYVHDAGTVGDGVFIVMELVEGETLTKWSAREPRPLADVLRVFIAAGRGLAAAHAAGLVHGDFKPQNVLVGADGRVRVTDFGLARPTEAASEQPAARAPAQASTVTVRGGTPGYMAPELFAGSVAHAGSDQFAFCVALFEALHGKAPHGPDGLRSGPVTVGATPSKRGRVDQPAPVSARPATRLVPAAVDEALMKGLRRDPAERHGSLEALLDLLEGALPASGGRWRLSRRGAIAVAAALIAIAGAGWGARHRLGLASLCGDGAVTGGEECDDGNDRDDDACLPTCRRARCGDGRVRARVEECDGTPGCSASCLLCRAGDASFVWDANGHCYSRHDRPVDWEAARALCGRSGGDLVRHLNLAEDMAVANALLRDRPAEYWMGLRKGRDGQFAWVSGEPFPPNVALWWQSQAKGPGQDCVYETWSPHRPMGAYDKLTRWPAAACDERRGFICERHPWAVFSGNGHAYAVLGPADGLSAQKVCAAVGAHLATITSAEENRFVADMVNLEVWIGANNTGPDAPYRWVTGEPFVYQAFAPGEPDQKKDARCVALDADDLWHDRWCHPVDAVLCEID